MVHDMELGATELAMALAAGGLPTGLPHTDPAFYLGEAAHWANAVHRRPVRRGDTLNLYDVCGFAHFDLYRAIQAAGDPAGLEVTRAPLLADMAKCSWTARWPRARPIPSGSGSRGRSGTRQPTVPGCR